MHPVAGAGLLAVGAGRGGHFGFDASGDVRAGVLSEVIFAVESCGFMI